MSIVEKKSAKGTPYGIVKFSDIEGEFELFLFAEILVSNRDKLKESESFVLTLQKDKISGGMTSIVKLPNGKSSKVGRYPVKSRPTAMTSRFDLLSCHGNLRPHINDHLSDLPVTGQTQFISSYHGKA